MFDSFTCEILGLTGKFNDDSMRVYIKKCKWEKLAKNVLMLPDQV